MNVVLCSAFRNSASYLPRYANQVLCLLAALGNQGHMLTCLWGEGDSHDGGRTLAMLEAASRQANAAIIDVTHGGKPYGSIVNVQRFRQLAHVGNTVWAQIPADADAVVWVEGDLIWDAATLLRLIDHLDTFPAVAPMIMDSPPRGVSPEYSAAETFYDTFCFRRNGRQFTKAPPYHADLPAMQRMVRMDAVGSCVAMRGNVARGVNFPIADVFVGLCAQIRAEGGSIWLDKSLTVYHP